MSSEHGTLLEVDGKLARDDNYHNLHTLATPPLYTGKSFGDITFNCWEFKWMRYDSPRIERRHCDEGTFGEMACIAMDPFPNDEEKWSCWDDDVVNIWESYGGTYEDTYAIVDPNCTP